MISPPEGCTCFKVNDLGIIAECPPDTCEVMGQSKGHCPLLFHLRKGATCFKVNDLGIDVVLAASKMDKVSDPDRTLDMIVERLGMLAPWRQWLGRVAPISAKKGKIEPLQNIVRSRL